MPQAGFVWRDAGQWFFHRKPIAGLGAERGAILQSNSLLPSMSVFAHLMLAVDQAFPDWNAWRRREHVCRYAEMGNLSHEALWVRLVDLLHEQACHKPSASHTIGEETKKHAA